MVLYSRTSIQNVAEELFSFCYTLTGGTAEAMSKITGTFGQALVSLSFDPNYKMVNFPAFVSLE